MVSFVCYLLFCCFWHMMDCLFFTHSIFSILFSLLLFLFWFVRILEARSYSMRLHSFPSFARTKENLWTVPFSLMFAKGKWSNSTRFTFESLYREFISAGGFQFLFASWWNDFDCSRHRQFSSLSLSLQPHIQRLLDVSVILH